jgi:hypothetical protein
LYRLLSRAIACGVDRFERRRSARADPRRSATTPEPLGVARGFVAVDMWMEDEMLDAKRKENGKAPKGDQKRQPADEERHLTEELEMTFPASDPPASIQPGGGVTGAEVVGPKPADSN